MMLRSLGVLLLGLTAQDGEPTAYERTIPRVEIRVSGKPGAETIDIVATRASLDALLRLVGRQANREVEGLDLLSRDPEITAKLESAELRDALRWIGGSVGLSIVVKANTIEVAEDLPPYPKREQLFDKAATGYFRALVDYPTSVSAPRAAWDSAEIEASRPDRTLEAARAFAKIAGDYPGSDMEPKALLRAGLAYGMANAWDEAAASFDTLAGLPRRHDYALTARRLLADAHTQVAAASKNPLVAAENARRALLVLENLDDRDPTADGPERRARAIVRSRAHSLVGEPVEALKALDIAQRYSVDGENDVELAELRARAFERSERYGDAVRAWLRYGNLAGGDARVKAFVRAAKTANDGREHLTALTIAKVARNQGFGAALAPAEATAWAALDMEPTRTDFFGDPERLERGEVLVRQGKFDQAIDALRPVFERFQSLTESESKRLALAYGRALAEQGQIDEAMLAFRRLTETQRRGADRRDLYLVASDLLEAKGEVERAIRALEGQL